MCSHERLSRHDLRSGRGISLRNCDKTSILYTHVHTYALQAIYQYDSTGRGPCFAYESPKTALTWFKSTYLIITSPPLSSTVPSYRPGSARTANINFTPQPGQQTSSSDLTRLTIFDTANKFVAFKDSFIGGIRGVVCEWGSIWIFGLDNKVCLKYADSNGNLLLTHRPAQRYTV
jgi:hypothetical protein